MHRVVCFNKALFFSPLATSSMDHTNAAAVAAFYDDMEYLSGSASTDYPAHRHYQHRSLPRRTVGATNQTSLNRVSAPLPSEASLTGQYTFPHQYSVNSPARTARSVSRANTSPDLQVQDLYHQNRPRYHQDHHRQHRQQRHSVHGGLTTAYPGHNRHASRKKETANNYTVNGHGNSTAIAYGSLDRHVATTSHSHSRNRSHHHHQHQLPPSHSSGYYGDSGGGGSQDSSRKSDQSSLTPTDSIPWEHYPGMQSDPSLPYDGSGSGGSSRRSDLLQSLDDFSDHSQSDSTQTSDHSDHSQNKQRYEYYQCLVKYRES